MKVGVMCEYSGIVRDAFLARGHDAVSLDIIDTESPGPHIVGDVVEHLKSIPDGHYDLLILHPPCTYLSGCGNRHYGRGTPEFKKRAMSLIWTVELWLEARFKSRMMCMENPVGVLHPQLRKFGADVQFVQPYNFGHFEQKKTGLALHNLPKITKTNDVYDEMMKMPKKERERIFYMSPSEDRGKKRSEFYTGIAEAMAYQWGKL